MLLEQLFLWSSPGWTTMTRHILWYWCGVIIVWLLPVFRRFTESRMRCRRAAPGPGLTAAGSDLRYGGQSWTSPVRQAEESQSLHLLLSPGWGWTPVESRPTGGARESRNWANQTCRQSSSEISLWNYCSGFRAACFILSSSDTYC